jgi:predicted acetyltransferase
MTHSELIFRLATERDRNAILNLVRLSFAPMSSIADLEQQLGDRPINPTGRQDWVVANAQDKLVACYRQFDYDLYVAGVPFKMAGVGAVSVGIPYRGQGIAGWMLTQALQEYRDKGCLLSMLYPFRHSFYRKLGWARVGEAHQYRVSSQHLPLYPERSRILPFHPKQEEDLKHVYHQTAKQHNGWLQRQPWQWENFFKPKAGRELYVYQDEGDVLGYVMLDFHELEPEKSQLAVKTREWVAATPAAYRGIVGFLGSLRDQVTTIIWNTYPDDPFPHLLQEQRIDPALTTPPLLFDFMVPFGAIAGGFMWRLVNPQAAIARRPIQPGAPFALTFDLTDPVFGAEQFTVEFAAGQMHLVSQPASTILKTSVVHLAELFSGSRRSRQLHWTGELELAGDESLLDQLDAAWMTRSPFCWDAF